MTAFAFFAKDFSVFMRIQKEVGTPLAESRPSGPQRGPGPLARLFRRIGEWRHRRQVMNELAVLSDRDLADLGLSRQDIPHLFDPDFAPRYEENRRYG